MKIEEYIKNNVDKRFDGNLPFKTVNKTVKKKSILTNFGQFESKVYFLNKGIIQVEIDSSKEIRILDFFFENSFFSSYSSLLNQTASDVRIRAITECDIEIIEYADLQQSYESSLIANKLGRFETEKLYLKRVLREKMLLTENAKDNYLLLTTKYPEVIKRIPLKDIAKYLGITPESLSRIRKTLIS
ncbi:Crp/Fnr family transcriptional regulator [Tunicatimonas pelagia]|uniref:Crp/Fnr family transcriptional regulator n=1 Tax=Tunicatimonas pelagia TaxID=931531 RepID=UPI002666CFCA|nr:cyclic nucleotide-binding domain-containing protein [Tunicatimonas pelagia]WKN43510.1 Crp/Fnr family transcriptional regulator [Tunicatimonas pelagia]